MISIRLIQRASILAGMTFASFPFLSTPTHAEPDFCIIASNGKTVCGKTKGIERMCVTTDGSNTICGKFKSIREEQVQGQEETRTPAQGASYQKESDGINYVLRSCRREDSNLKCNLVITTKKEGKRANIRAGKGSSSIIDSTGKTYPSSTLEYNGAPTSGFSSDLSLGVDYVVDINFENVPKQITKAALLNLSTDKVVQFRNVSISN
jgi:hypothetical protein